MGGVDKAALTVGGTTLLDRVLAAVRPVCDRLVVVGPERPVAVDGVRFVREAEPGGGPVPAVLAGVDACAECDVVLVVAVDLPLLDTPHLALLLAALGRVEAAASSEAKGPNPLLAAYRVPALLLRAAGLGPGSPAGRLLPPAPALVDLGRAALNVNRPADGFTYEFEIDTAELAERHHRLFTRLVNAGGEELTRAATLTVDRSPTQVHFTDPAPGAALCGPGLAPLLLRRVRRAQLNFRSNGILLDGIGPE